MRRVSGFVVLACAGLVSCGGGGGGGAAGGGVICASLAGEVTGGLGIASCSGCGDHDPEHIADGNLSTFYRLFTQEGSLEQTFDVTPSAPRTFEPDSFVGGFMTLRGAAGAGDITLTTYNDSTPAEVATGDALVVTPTDGRTAAENYVGFYATLAFTRLSIRIRSNAASEFQVYEVCGDAIPSG